MRFDHLLQSIDMNHCQDQQQRQAMFDLGLFLVAADGKVNEQETAFMNTWLTELKWSSEVSKQDYYRDTLLKCYAAIKNDGIDEFILHRANLLLDADMKQQALKLVNEVALADGELDSSEQKAIDILSKALGH
ncbi:tellurite resistance TerB family protein [Paraglaciecola sp.]|uniref:tellurite resistance TerB family protein n=1 Tax=Paraglaciecola sp. TaxID=1920173 RepID=UPI003EF5D6CE